MSLKNVSAAVFGFELVEPFSAVAMHVAQLSCRNPSILFFAHAGNLDLSKKKLSRLLAPSKIEKTLL